MLGTLYRKEIQHIPLIPVLGRQRQADLCEFEASLVCRAEFQDRLQSDTEKPLSEKQKQNKTKKTHIIKGLNTTEMVL